MIGTALSKRLLRKEGYTIDGIDIKTLPTEAFDSSLQFTRMNIMDSAAITKLVANGKYDCIVHLAAISRVVEGEINKSACIQTNYIGTKNIINAIAKFSPKTHLVFASSREVYGEQQNLPVSEDAELLPINVYGFYKLLAEKYIHENLSNYTILRLCNVYGAANDIPGRVIPNFVHRAIYREPLTIEGGCQVIDFTHIDDTVWAISRCIELIPNGTVNRETITISPGEGHTLQEVIDILIAELGHDIDVYINHERDYDVQRFVADISHRKHLLGDHEFLSLPDGLRRTLSLYKTIK